MPESSGNRVSNITFPIGTRSTIRSMPDLAHDENERLREAMRLAKDEMFGGNVTSLAKAIGRSQPSISDFLNGVGGASLETARRFAKVTGQPLWKILGAETSTVPTAPARDKLHFLPDTIHLDEAERAHVVAAMTRGVTQGVVLDVLGQTIARGADRPSPEGLYQMLLGAQQLLRSGAKAGTPVTDDTSGESLPRPKDVAKRRRKKPR